MVKHTQTWFVVNSLCLAAVSRIFHSFSGAKSVQVMFYSFLRDFSNSSTSIGQTPTNILLFTIINAIHPVNVETVKKICLQHAEVQRIVIFHKNGLQALVEFVTIEDAQRVQQALNGCDIFAGCCTLKIDFSKVYL